MSKRQSRSDGARIRAGFDGPSLGEEAGDLYRDVPDRLSGRPVFQSVWGRMHKLNKNWMCAFCGETGSGKSLSAISVANYLDPDFGLEKIAFTVEEFVELINEDHPPGSIIVVDEASVSMNAKTWWDSDQIQIGNILDTWRHQNRGMISTLPAFYKLQKDARGRMHNIATSWTIDYIGELAKFKWFYVDEHAITGKNYEQYRTFKDPDTGVEREYRFINCPLPPDDLLEAYEERKKDYTDEINRETLESIREGDEDEDESQSPKDIARSIMDDDRLNEFLYTAPSNGMTTVATEFLQEEFDLTEKQAKTARKYLEKWREEG